MLSFFEPVRVVERIQQDSGTGPRSNPGRPSVSFTGPPNGRASGASNQASDRKPAYLTRAEDLNANVRSRSQRHERRRGKCRGTGHCSPARAHPPVFAFSQPRVLAVLHPHAVASPAMPTRPCVQASYFPLSVPRPFIAFLRLYPPHGIHLSSHPPMRLPHNFLSRYAAFGIATPRRHATFPPPSAPS